MRVPAPESMIGISMMTVFEWCFWLFVAGLSVRFVVTICRLAIGNRRDCRRLAKMQTLEVDFEESIAPPKWRPHHFVAAGIVVFLAIIFLPISLGFSVGNAISRVGQLLRTPRRNVEAAPLKLPLTSIEYRKTG